MPSAGVRAEVDAQINFKVDHDEAFRLFLLCFNHPEYEAVDSGLNRFQQMLNNFPQSHTTAHKARSGTKERHAGATRVAPKKEAAYDY